MVSEFLSKPAPANSLLSMCWTQLVVGRASAVVYLLQVSFSSSANLTSVLLKEKKSILRTISMRVSANKKVTLKNQTLSRLFCIKNLAKAILYISKSEPSIFWAPTLVGLGLYMPSKSNIVVFMIVWIMYNFRKQKKTSVPYPLIPDYRSIKIYISNACLV